MKRADTHAFYATYLRGSPWQALSNWLCAATRKRWRSVKREVSGWMRCFTRYRSEARGQHPLTPPVFPSLYVLEAHPRQRSDRAHDTPPEAELTPLEGTCSHHPTYRDAPQGAHENLLELSSKMSSPRDRRTRNYITLIQQCMSKAQTNKLITA